MIRLDFQLPDFTRLLWASASARKIWEPRISQINKEWDDVQYRSVKEDFRKGCILPADLDSFSKLQIRAAEDGLIPYVIGLHSVRSIYAATPEKFDGTHGQFSIAILQPAFLQKFVKALAESDNSEIGRILGYPDCCIRFFQRYWIEEKWVDTTYPMVMIDPDFNYEVPPENNILLRWLGVRLVPHLPCSFNCKWTTAFALQLESLWNQGILEDAKEMLRWPIEWSALHGIAEIKTPFLKIGTRTDATAEKITVMVKPGILDSDLFILNGFKDSHGMETAHGVLMGEALSLKGIKSVLDLGCGNGYFLDKYRTVMCPSVALGVDVNEDAIEFARREFPKIEALHSNIFDLPEKMNGNKYDLAIFMPGRLEEESNLEKREEFLRWLHGSVAYVLLYGYEDWSWLVPRLTDRFFNYQWDRIGTTESARVTTILLRSRV